MKRRSITQVERDAYIERIQSDPCFICRIVEGDPNEVHNVIYQDHMAVVFLNRYPTLYGYTLVAPLEHREHVTGDFNLDEYLQLQELIYRVAEAVRMETNAERVYLLSLGSQQATSHVHWHIAPLPSGIPFDEQQLKALSFESGILELTEDEKSSIARRIRNRIEGLAGA